MRVTEHLKITAEEFFAIVDEALLADISNARGKAAKPSNLHEGYTYKKFLRGKSDAAHAATVRISTYDRPRSYRSTVTAPHGESVMGYDVEPAGDGIDVTYVEDFQSQGGIQALLSAMMTPIQSFGAKGRIKSQLHAMEGKVLAERYQAPDDAETGDGASEA